MNVLNVWSLEDKMLCVHSFSLYINIYMICSVEFQCRMFWSLGMPQSETIQIGRLRKCITVQLHLLSTRGDLTLLVECGNYPVMCQLLSTDVEDLNLYSVYIKEIKDVTTVVSSE